MVQIKSILCPVDFSAATARQIAMAADLSRVFGARLVVHHNVEAVPIGAGVGWMYAAEAHRGVESEYDAEQRLQRLVAEIPDGIVVEGCVTRGLPWSSVVNAAQAEHAQLVVLATHGDATDEHASVTEQVLEEARSLVLVMHDPSVDTRAPRFSAPTGERQVFLVPTDFSADAQPAVSLAFELARQLPIELHLLYVEATLKAGHDVAALGADQHRLESLVPEDLRSRAVVHVTTGDPGREIAKAAEKLSAACIVMGEHAHTPLKRWFTHDTSRDVLRFAHCPIWYVPAQTS